MKTLIIYYSRTKTTEKLANALQQEIYGDLEEIFDTKKRLGFWGYLMAGKDALLKRSTIIKEPVYQPTDYDLVVIGTPVWAGDLTPAIRTYLKKNQGKFKRIAFFCTQGSEAKPLIFNEMEKICKQKPLATLMLRTIEVTKKQYQDKIDNFIETIKIRGNFQLDIKNKV